MTQTNISRLILKDKTILNQTLRENETALATFFEGSWILLKTTFFICFRLVNNIYAILVYVSRVLAEL